MDLSFFADMAWKSALIAGAALALGWFLRSRSPADRALVLRIGVAMLLLLPFIALWMPALEVVAFAAPEAAPAAAHAAPAELELAALAGAAAAEPGPTIWDDPTPLVLLAYLGGLAMVGSRLLAGLWLLHRWTRRAEPVTCAGWLAAFDRVRWSIADDDKVRLMVSADIGSPLSWGWRRPVILIDPDTLAQPDDAEAILAHEAAHVARRDWPALMLTRLAATLFWFNPLVWKLEREIVQQAEEAADLAAAERVEPARYAETLLSWARGNLMVPANSIAPTGSALGRRVRAVLDRRLRERPSQSAWTAFAILVCMGVAAPVAAMQLVAAAPEPPAAPAAPAAPEAPPAPGAPEAPPAPPPPEAIVVTVPDLADVAPEARAALAEVLPRIPAIVARAHGAVAPEALEQALREAEAELRRMPHMDRAEIEAAMREARRAMREPPRVRVVPAVPAPPRVRIAPVAGARPAPTVAVSMAHGADGMLRGAEGMEAGARRMERDAARLEERDYRERAIARARARGETVSHEQLIEAARGLREGAEGLREGAQGMRESAERMRRGRD